MAKSQQTFNKNEKEKKRQKKREEKLARKEERKANKKSGDLDNMMAYIDEDGNITDTPPDPTKKREEVDASSIVLGIPKKEEADPADSIHRGKVDYFDSSKGFGFIIDSDTQEKYFVHVTGLLEDVMELDKVTFELEKGMKGMNAVRVKKI